LIRLRRNVESWNGKLLHDLISEINWGITNGAGDDLLDFIMQAKILAVHGNSLGTRLTLLRLERMVIVTHTDSSEERVERLKSILDERGSLLTKDVGTTGVFAEIEAEWDRKPHRVKSDLLFRLSKTLEDSEFRLLWEYMRLYTKNGKQFRLVEYFRDLESWSKQKEKADWRGEQLAQLKNRTLLWLMRKMGMLGKWQGAEVHGYIGDIRWCISMGLDPFDLGFFAIAEEKAKQEEEFEHLLTLLELKAENEKKRKGQANTEDAEKVRLVLGKLREIEHIHRMRVQHFERIKVKTVRSGINHLEGWRKLDAELRKVDPRAITTSEALREYFVLLMMAEHSLGNNVEAVRIAETIAKLHYEHPHLKRSNWKRYFKEQRASVFIFALGGEFEKARGAIEEMRSLGRESKNLLIQSVTMYLFSIDHLYSVSGDPGLALDAINAYKSNKHLLKYSGESRNWIGLHFLISKAALQLANYKDAMEAINNIIDQKRQSNLYILGHSRVMMLIAYLGLKTEIDYVYHAANACSMFIHRHKNLPKVLSAAVHAIKRIASYDYETDLQFSAIEDAINTLNEYSTKGQSSNVKEISFNYSDSLTILLEGFKDRQR
jgi:hypothetical protein